MKKLILLFVFYFALHASFSQSVGIGTLSPNTSAQLDVASTSKGLLIPRMTTVQRIAIASPANGLMVYDTNLAAFYFFNGTAWTPFNSSGGGSNWAANGNHIYNSNTGNVGIGTNTPTSKLHIAGNSMLINGSDPILQFQQTGVNRGYIQASGENLRLGTNAGNQLGKTIIRMAGEDRIFIDSTGNMQIVGLQDASLTSDGYITLGSTSGRNMILDNNEIIVRDGTGTDNLILQNDGGNVGIGEGSPAEQLTITKNMKLNGNAGLIKFETEVGGTGSPFASTKYAPGLQFLRKGTSTQLAKIEYVDTSNFANFIRMSTSSGIENGITLNTDNRTGIGTHNPLARLHVRGGAGIDEIAINSGAISSSESATIQFYNSASIGGGASTKKVFMMLDDEDLKIGTNSGNSAGKFIVRTNGGDRVFVNEAGNMGIGVAAPTSRLQVEGNAALTGNLGVGTTVPQSKLHVAGRGLFRGVGEVLAIDGSSNPNIGFYYNGVFRSFISQTTTNLVVGVNGGGLQLDAQQVAIGGVVPAASGYKLTVTGKVICEELKVQLQNAWPDYVFHKKYNLMPLSELRDFVNTNNHLPNIPSAATIEKNGIEVGEMQRKMMEKIEELTLYVLELEERVNALTKK